MSATLTLEEAARFLHLHPSTLEAKARSGDIPGAKLGKRWVFLEVDLTEHVRSHYPARALLRKAVNDWEWMDKVPRIRMLPEPRRRIRWITREEADRLLAELPEHLRAMARFSLETGVRNSNVTGLQWSQVDLRRRCAWVHPDQAKGRKAIAVPRSTAAI
jgi:excisionase family DNA binding protein